MFIQRITLETRLRKRAEKIMTTMKAKTTAIIQQFCEDRASVRGACRFFNHPSVRPELTLAALSKECSGVVEDKTILLIQDATEIARTHLLDLHATNHVDISRISGKEHCQGFFVHPIIAVEASTGMPLDVAGGYLWNRSAEMTEPSKKNYWRKKRSEKESSRWIDCARTDESVRPEPLFTTDQQQCAEAIMSRYEGKTKAQNNPYRKGSMRHYLWLIAHLGGWKGFASEAKLGPITMRRGFQCFAQMYEAWTIFKEQ